MNSFHHEVVDGLESSFYLLGLTFLPSSSLMEFLLLFDSAKRQNSQHENGALPATPRQDGSCVFRIKRLSRCQRLRIQ